MAAPFPVLVHLHTITIFLFFFNHFFFVDSLTGGSSLSVENNDVLVSPNGLFTAGFHQVGENAFCFAVWFTDQPTNEKRTVVWMANRDAPVNGKYSKLSLLNDGNLVLIDADLYIIWSTDTKSNSSTFQLQLYDTGNLVLFLFEGKHLWQSFDYPTDTLLPYQRITMNTKLVSSRSCTNYSSGFYNLILYFDAILRLHYDGPGLYNIYWPEFDLSRHPVVHTRPVSFYSVSDDGFAVFSDGFGIEPLRFMRIDIDGNLRVYSLIKHLNRSKWQVQWQAISQSCIIPGFCGPSSVCTYSQVAGRGCTCLHGYKMVNVEDWSYGCEPEFDGCRPDEEDFINLPQVNFHDHDVLYQMNDARYYMNCTLNFCKKEWLADCFCKGFQFSYNPYSGIYTCYIKSSLINGYQSGSYDTIGYQSGSYDTMYIRLPNRLVLSFDPKPFNNFSFSCAGKMMTQMIRSYHEKHDNKVLNIVALLGCMIGFIEIIVIVFFWYKSTKHWMTTKQSYFPVATTFRKFTYSELKKASRNFSDEIGRGGASVVYKGILSDKRIAAIKKLKNTNYQGEEEFQSDSIISRLNHMNLIETLGYCAEGKRRLIVYEYMENGSLAGNLHVGKLDWKTMLKIAKGTAKGLTYLHDECLEWVLHCDVKPQNILLDSNYNPKVADFGLSKLFDRDPMNNSNFSTVRGTRGYMAPEWVFKRPITSKVDVFSYGVVILEMIMGRSLAGKQQISNGNGGTDPALIEWMRDRIKEFDGSRMDSWVEEIVNPTIIGEYDRTAMEKLVKIALQCADEDMKVRPKMKQVVHMRPKMKQVVHMLLHQETNSMSYA